MAMFSEQDPGDILSSSVKMLHAAHLRGSTHCGHEDPASSQLGALTSSTHGGHEDPASSQLGALTGRWCGQLR